MDDQLRSPLLCPLHRAHRFIIQTIQASTVSTAGCVPFYTTENENTTLIYCSVSSSDSYTTRSSSSTYANPSSLSELRLEAALGPSVMTMNQKLTLVINETNLSNEILNVSGKPEWVGDYCDGLNLPGALDFPIKLALFSGYDTESNISQASSIYFHVQLMCPDYFLSQTDVLVYSFSPQSDIANVTNWIPGDDTSNFKCSLPQGQYCISYSLQLSQCCYLFHQEYTLPIRPA